MSKETLNCLCEKLKYKFKNIVLLHEALTHSFEENEENKYFSPFPGVLYKQKNNGRLHTLGIRVFEQLCVEQAVNQFANQELTIVVDPEKNEKRGTKLLSLIKAEFQISKYFEIVGEQLSLKDYIKTTKEFKGRVEDLYEPVIKAIFGAIFIDSGGCYGRLGSKVNPLQETRNVFLHLWRLPEFDENEACELLEKGISINPSAPKKFEGLSEYLSISDFKRAFAYDSKLNYKFLHKRFIRKSLTVNEKENDPIYWILKLVGDTVWELVIAEYLYWFYVNDEKQTHFNDKAIGIYCHDDFLLIIACAIDIDDDLIPKRAANLWEYHKFLKSLVGAIYLDSGCSLASTKKSIVHLCENNRLKIANFMKKPLPHSTKTYRGTCFHTTGKYYCIVDHGPPKRQEPFKITNVSEFMKVIGTGEFEVNPDHADQMGEAEKEEELDYKRILTCSEDRCNQLEYERVSLYHTLNRMRSDRIPPNGDVIITEHTYGRCLCNGDMVTPDCSEFPEVTRPLKLTEESVVVSNAKFFEALEIIFVWVLMWLTASYQKVKRSKGRGWRIVEVICRITYYGIISYTFMKVLYLSVLWLVRRI